MRYLATVALVWATAAHADPAAWRIAGRGGGEVVLLGSVHYLRDIDYPLPGLIDELYARADTLVMELDLDDMDPTATSAQFIGAAALGPQRKLADVVTPDVYDLAATKAASLGIDIALLDAFEPWLVAVTLLDLGMAEHGYRPDRGVEQYLLHKAVADNKPILGLETLAAQIAIFDALSADDQEALLEQTLAELDAAAQMDELVDAWRRGELAALAANLMEEFETFPDLYEPLVVDRNAAWLTTLDRLLATGGRYLVVVGALHLVGDESVIELLEKRGISVVPVP